ncbi:MAG: hypothetical protein IH611_11670 [Deltaproteobacteria bacterium]|nr:hypothetical protein [Deltaproteobacteria bacterium]
MNDNDSSGATVQGLQETGAEVYGKTERAVSDVYDKTARAATETYEKTRKYSVENPGKTILVSLGIGAGLGYLMGARSRASRTSRIAHPLVNAVSGIAREFFR